MIIPWNKSGNFYFPHHHAGLVFSDLKVNAPEQLVHLHVCAFPLFKGNKKTQTRISCKSTLLRDYEREK